MDMQTLKHDIENKVKAAVHKFAANDDALNELKQDSSGLVYAVLQDVASAIHNPIERVVLEKVVKVLVAEALDVL